MSERTRLETGAVGEMQALGAFGRPVHSLYAQLRAVVETRLSPRHAGLFAEPVLHSADNRIDWYAPAGGAALRLSALPPDQAAAVLATLQQLAADLSSLSAELAASTSDSDQALGHLIGLALSTPDDSHIFVVGDQPVLTFWGFARRGGGVQTAPLYGYGGQAAQPAAAAPAIAATVAARGSALPWLMWSFAGLLLLIAVLLLLKTEAGVNVPGLAWLDQPGEEGPTPASRPDPIRVADAPAVRGPADDSALVAARQQERGLRAQLAALEAEYAGARDACPVPQQRPPAITPIPDRDRPAVIPDRPVDRVDRPDRVIPLPDRDADVAALDRNEPVDPGLDEPVDPSVDEPPADDPTDDPLADEPSLGAPLTIDEAARSAQDLAALEGEWRTGRSLMDQGSADPLEIELSFDAEGRGRTTIRLEDGITCSAQAEAAYNGPDAIVITELDHPACSDGSEFERSEIVCLIDADGTTLCEGAQAGGSGYPVGLYEAGS